MDILSNDELENGYNGFGNTHESEYKDDDRNNEFFL